MRRGKLAYRILKHLPGRSKLSSDEHSWADTGVVNRAGGSLVHFSHLANEKGEKDSHLSFFMLKLRANSEMP